MHSCVNMSKGPDNAVTRMAFAAWSEVYDQQPNPLLSLEQRFLTELLPDLRGLEVIDVGCGTGRWLAQLANRGAASLTGIDSSPEMVGHARSKLGPSAHVLLGEATSLPLSDRSADVLLVSFVASYVDDLHQFAAELRRVARAGARIYLSDLHPATASECNWKRGFKVEGEEVEFAAHSRSVADVISCFEALGFTAVLRLEPAFGAPEEEILCRAGKMPAFHAAAGRPAIYILHLELAQERSRGSLRHATSQLNFTGARIAFGPDAAACAEIGIISDQISFIGCTTAQSTPEALGENLDLGGYLVLPGLINSHDHLEFGLFPNLGHGPYDNFEQWATDIQQSERDVIQRHRSVPKDVRLWWGAIRNLLCGVTTVCHHNPLDPEFFTPDFPVRVLSEFGWAHSVALDSDLRIRFQTTPANLPFILHAAEGVDEKSANEIFQLDRIRALDGRTVLVHGLGLTAEGISLLNRRGASLVWCPTSNHFLFGQTHCRESLAAVDNLVLGSDSPLTAAGDLLDEIHYARLQTGVDAHELYRLAITRPCAVFRFEDGRGTLQPGAAADLIAVRDTGASPANTLAQMFSGDVELVLVAGRVQLASQELFQRLPQQWTSGLQPLEVDGQLRWVRAPLGRLFGEATHALGCNITLGKKKVRHVCTRWI